MLRKFLFLFTKDPSSQRDILPDFEDASMLPEGYLFKDVQTGSALPDIYLFFQVFIKKVNLKEKDLEK